MQEFDADALATGLTFVYATNNPDGALQPDELTTYNTSNRQPQPDNSPQVQAELVLPDSLGQASQG